MAPVEAPQLKHEVRRHLGRAVRILRAMEMPDDDAVHEARKALKRARTGLRLLRPTLAAATYAHEKERLRGAARQLAAVRDDRVQLDALGMLLREEKDPARRALLARLRDGLRKDRRGRWRAIAATEAPKRLAGVLSDSARRVEGLDTGADGVDALAEALEGLYRKARKGLKRSRRPENDETLHEARKRVKHLAHALEMLAGGAAKGRARKVLKRLDKAGDLLGVDHDLAVLEAQLASVKDGAAGEALRKAIDKRRGKLQKKALKRSKPAFGRKTRKLLRKLGGR